MFAGATGEQAVFKTVKQRRLDVYEIKIIHSFQFYISPNNFDFY